MSNYQHLDLGQRLALSSDFLGHGLLQNWSQTPFEDFPDTNTYQNSNLSIPPLIQSRSASVSPTPDPCFTPLVTSEYNDVIDPLLLMPQMYNLDSELLFETDTTSCGSFSGISTSSSPSAMHDVEFVISASPTSSTVAEDHRSDDNKSPMTAIQENSTKESLQIKVKKLGRLRRKAEKPEVCPVCKKGHTYRRELERHLKTNHPSEAVSLGISLEKVKCEYPDCKTTFSRNDHYKRHKKTQHGKN